MHKQLAVLILKVNLFIKSMKPDINSIENSVGLDSWGLFRSQLIRIHTCFSNSMQV